MDFAYKFITHAWSIKEGNRLTEKIYFWSGSRMMICMSYLLIEMSYLRGLGGNPLGKASASSQPPEKMKTIKDTSKNWNHLWESTSTIKLMAGAMFLILPIFKTETYIIKVAIKRRMSWTKPLSLLYQTICRKEVLAVKNWRSNLEESELQPNKRWGWRWFPSIKFRIISSNL